MRGCLGVNGQDYFLQLGRHDTSIVLGQQINVSLDIKGPQQDNLADDIVAVLGANSAVHMFFDGLPTLLPQKIPALDRQHQTQLRYPHPAHQ